MAEYIEREAALGVLCEYCPCDPDCNKEKCYEYMRIREMPAADVVEVRHGRWLPSPDGFNPIRCSECNMPALFTAEQDDFGHGFYRHPSNYCPNCGADMRGDKK